MNMALSNHPDHARLSVSLAKVLPCPDLNFRREALFANMFLPESEPSQG
jgi:hypothetical protein